MMAKPIQLFNQGGNSRAVWIAILSLHEEHFEAEAKILFGKTVR